MNSKKFPSIYYTIIIERYGKKVKERFIQYLNSSMNNPVEIWEKVVEELDLSEDPGDIIFSACRKIQKMEETKQKTGLA